MDRLIDDMESLLASQDFVEFALLFGSFARGKETPLSDIDFGIYLSRPIDLLTLGRLTAELERIAQRQVEILVLNDILASNPKLAYQVVASGELIVCKDRSAYVDFKAQVILRYLDTAYLRSIVDKAFLERLRDDRFGARSHA